ncbi:MAG TPA: cyclic nucleotide-binding domain-containing protein [Thermoanaerobaculaceae bacterium]|nr:cyclic nucleotide-binding domain-containing protein [Thermoanaerobaculaceae bacterium]
MADSDVQPHPVFAQRLIALAEQLERAGQPGFAAELYELAASLTPKGESYRARAAALRRVSPSPEDAEREHKRHNLEASHAVGMARVLEVRGELARAQEMFDLAKLRAPFHYLAYAGAGYLHLRRRDLRAALEEFVQARRLNPLDRKLAVEAARIALELEDYPEALRHATDALLLSQGLGEGEVAAARRRVDTLAALCRLTKEELSDHHAQRATALQRASEQVALTRARLFSTLTLSETYTHRVATAPKREELLRVALDLRRFRVFRHFSDAHLVLLAQIGRRETIGHANVLTREGHEDRDIYVVMTGRLQESRKTPIGTQMLGQPGLGDVIGEISFLDRKPRYSTVIAVDAGSVLRFPAPDLDHLVNSNRDLGVALLWSFWHSLSAKVRAANSAMTELITPGLGPGRNAPGEPGERVFLDQSAKVDVLREQGLSAAELRLLATYSQEERFQPNALIFSEGERGDKLYIVVDGQVRISRRLQGMGEEALTILSRGEVFGEMALIDEQPRSADARAHTGGCTVFTVDSHRLEEVLEMDPDASHQFLGLLCQILCRRIRAMTDRLVAWRLMAGHE